MNIAYKYSLQTYFVVKTEVNYDNGYGNHNLVSEHSQNIETLQDWEEKGGCLGEIHFVLVRGWGLKKSPFYQTFIR